MFRHKCSKVAKVEGDAGSHIDDKDGNQLKPRSCCVESMPVTTGLTMLL